MEQQYNEKHFSLGITLILGIVTAGILFWLIYQLANGPVGSKPAPTWFLLLMGALFILITINFSFMRITLSQKGIRASYGILGTSRPWTAIVACEPDDKKHFYGWGIRFGRYKGEWVWVFNTMGGDRVVFLTNTKKPRGLVLSTKNPAKILAYAKQYIKPS